MIVTDEIKRGFKGVWIPSYIWENKELSIQEKVFIAEIDSLDNDDGCFASNEYFSNFFGLSKNRCSEVIKSLEKKGFVNISYVYKTGTKAIEKRVIKVVCEPIRYYDQGIREPDKDIRNHDGGSRNPDLVYSENWEDNNINNNNTINNINNNIYKEKYKKEKPKSKSKSKKQSIDEMINEYTSNEELINTIYDFIEMRKTIKKPVTERAMKIAINTLEKYAKGNDALKIAMIEKSITNCWSGIFELKEYNKGYNNKPYGSRYNTNKPTPAEMEELRIKEYNKDKEAYNKRRAEEDAYYLAHKEELEAENASIDF